MVMHSSTLTLPLTLYDSSIPEHTLLILLTLHTSHETKHFANRRRLSSDFSSDANQGTAMQCTAPGNTAGVIQRGT